jgi:amidase
MTGPHALAASLGPLARGVEDLALMFRVLAGEACGGAGEVEEDLRGTRAAVFYDDGTVPVEEEVRAAVACAAEALGEAGLLVSEGRPRAFERANELWLELFSYPTLRFLREAFEGREDEAGPTARAILRRDAATPTAEALLSSWRARDEARAALLRWMERTPLLVAPVGPVAAFMHEGSRRVEVRGETFNSFRAFALAQACNVYDLPAACVPVGVTREGLPVGVQIAGRPFDERRVLAAARVVERALGGRVPRPV